MFNDQGGMEQVKARLAAAKANMPDAVRTAHDHSTKHRLEVMASDKCGCFYCLGVFSPHEIVEWIDAGETAMCPRCGIDSVIGSKSGYPLTQQFLEEMHLHWF